MMRIVNFYEGANPFIARNAVTYSPDDIVIAQEAVMNAYPSRVKNLKGKDYSGFCVDIEFDHVVGLVRLGELTEDTNVLRVWAHRIPVQKRCLISRQTWETKLEVAALSVKKAEGLVYTCEQVIRYGCPWSLMSQMSDFNDKAEGIAQ